MKKRMMMNIIWRTMIGRTREEKKRRAIRGRAKKDRKLQRFTSLEKVNTPSLLSLE